MKKVNGRNVRSPKDLEEESGGSKKPCSIYLDEREIEWLDKNRGRVSRSQVVAYAIRLYRELLSSTDGSGKD
jgi:hypothetical protein